MLSAVQFFATDSKAFDKCTHVPNCDWEMTAVNVNAAQPNTTLLDCTLYLMQYPYDPGILPSSAN